MSKHKLLCMCTPRCLYIYIYTHTYKDICGSTGNRATARDPADRARTCPHLYGIYHVLSRVIMCRHAASLGVMCHCMHYTCGVYDAWVMFLRGLRRGPFECDFHKSATSIRSSTCKRTLNLRFAAAALQKKGENHRLLLLL